MQAEQRSPEWFKQREGRITASSVGAIMGLAPYAKRKDVMRRMVREYRGLESEFKGNSATEWGTFNEEGAIAEFQMETGLKVEPAPFVPYYEWLGASPDGYTSDGHIIEIKCPYGLRDGEGELKSIAEQQHYYAQIQMQLVCTNMQKCYFYQWMPSKTKLEIVDRNNEYIANMIKECATFYEEYAKEREMPNAKKYLDIDVTEELEAMMTEYVALKEQSKEIEAKQKELLSGMVALTDEVGGVIAGHKLYKIERSGNVSYANVVKELLPDIDLEPYKGKPSISWAVK